MATRHTVQFFDGPESLGRDVAAYFAEGLGCRDRLLLMARRAHVAAVTESLAERSISVSDLVAAGELTIIESASALRTIMANGRPRGETFERVIGDAIRSAAARGPVQLRIYAELVDVLVCENNLRGCEELEAMWRALLEQVPMRLHTGYTSATFATARMGAAMKRICDRHDAVHRNDTDLLANWLLAQHT
jgi:hypothetical protein